MVVLTAAVVLLLASSAAARSATLAGSSLLTPLKDAGDSPMRMVACIGSEGTGKSTLMRTMFGSEVGTESVLAEDGLVLLEAESGGNRDSKAPLSLGAIDAAVAVATSDVVIYNVFLHDLARSSLGILSELQPAMEEVLSLRAAGLLSADQQHKTLMIAVRDYDESEISEADVESAVTAKLRSMWAAAVKPQQASDKAAGAANFDDYFRVSFCFLPHYTLSSQSYAKSADSLRAAVVASGVRGSAADLAARYKAVSSHIGTAAAAPGQKEMTAAYTAKSAAAACLSSYKSLASTLLQSMQELDPEFGTRVDSIISDVLAQYDAAVAAGGAGSSGIVSKKRAELQRAMVRDVQVHYARQLNLLQMAAITKFDKNPSTLRVSPAFVKDVAAAVKEAVAYYDEAVKGLKSKHVPALHAAERKELLNTLRSAASERLQLAKLQGATLSSKGGRKTVGVGLHWLLPQPFGTDVKQNVMAPKDPAAFNKSQMTADQLFFTLAPLDEVAAPSDSSMASSSSKRGSEETAIAQEVKVKELERLKRRASKMVYRRPQAEAAAKRGGGGY
jgi:Root hair defective 3 GTP-binding protein (RHD3)